VNPYIIVGALVALILSAGGGAWLGYDYRDGKCKAAELERVKLVEEIRTANLQLADGIATRTETAIGKIRIQNKTITNEVRHEREIFTKVLDNPDCALPLSTVGVLNRARGYGRPGAGEPAGKLPAPDAAP
jgi:hypothetical protein